MTTVAAGTPYNLTELFLALTRLHGVPVLKVDEADNDSDKTFTVPSATVWEILSIHVELVTTAGAGDRLIEVQMQDSSGDIIAQTVAGAVQAASVTRSYMFAPDAVDLTSFRDTVLMSNRIPKFILPAGFKVRIFDNNAVAASADDMVLQMLVLESAET